MSELVSVCGRQLVSNQLASCASSLFCSLRIAKNCTRVLRASERARRSLVDLLGQPNCVQTLGRRPEGVRLFGLAPIMISGGG